MLGKSQKIHEIIAASKPGGSTELAFGYLKEKVENHISKYSAINQKDLPEIIFTHSISPDIYTLSFGDRECVVYDEAYGLTATDFLKIYISGQDKKASYAEYIKQIASASYEAGCLELSSLCSVIYINMLDDTSREMEGHYPLVEFAIYINILFAITHEVYHAAHASVDGIARLSSEIEKEYRLHREEQSEFAKLLDSNHELHKALSRIYLRTLSEDRREGRIREEEYMSNNLGNIQATVTKPLLVAESAFLEECLCDFLSLDLVFKVATLQYNLNAEDAVKICATSMWCNWLIRDIRSDGNYFVKLAREILEPGLFKGVSDLNHDSTYEIARRNLFVTRFFIKKNANTESEQELLNEAFDSAHDRFDDLLGNNITQSYFQIFQELLCAKLSNMYKSREDGLNVSYDDMRYLTRTVLGLNEHDVRKV